MRIRATVPMASISQSYAPGQEYDVPDAEADLMIAAGHATAIDPNYKPNPVAKPQPMTLDQKPSLPVENVGAIKVAAPAAGVNAALTTEAITPTAVDAAKKASK